MYHDVAYHFITKETQKVYYTQVLTNQKKSRKINLLPEKHLQKKKKVNTGHFWTTHKQKKQEFFYLQQEILFNAHLHNLHQSHIYQSSQLCSHFFR